MMCSRGVHLSLVLGILCAELGCAASGAARGGRRPEPSYQTPPLPAWSAPTMPAESFDPALLEGEEVVDEQPGLDQESGLAGQEAADTPSKLPEPEKSVDAVPEEGQNSSTPPQDRGRVAPPPSD
jgi:hypothetical protein